MKYRFIKLFFLFFFFFLTAISGSVNASGVPSGFKILNIYPHDPTAFTQGLVYERGYLYEGTGLNGQSTLRISDLKTGRILKKKQLPAEYFGEGITILGNRIFQLTWRSGKGFIYDKSSLNKIGEFHYSSEGWGITQNGRYLIMSDGTAVLRFLDPRHLKVVRELNVTWEGRPLVNLNELECIKGEIYANIWGLDTIVRISQKTGKVTGWLDLKELRNYLGDNHQAETLNGIAYIPERDTLLVTGKNWPRLFEIRILQ